MSALKIAIGSTWLGIDTSPLKPDGALDFVCVASMLEEKHSCNSQNKEAAVKAGVIKPGQRASCSLASQMFGSILMLDSTCRALAMEQKKTAKTVIAGALKKVRALSQLLPTCVCVTVRPTNSTPFPPVAAAALHAQPKSAKSDLTEAILTFATLMKAAAELKAETVPILAASFPRPATPGDRNAANDVMLRVVAEAKAAAHKVSVAQMTIARLAEQRVKDNTIDTDLVREAADKLTMAKTEEENARADSEEALNAVDRLADQISEEHEEQAAAAREEEEEEQKKHTAKVERCKNILAGKPPGAAPEEDPPEVCPCDADGSDVEDGSGSEEEEEEKCTGIDPADAAKVAARLAGSGSGSGSGSGEGGSGSGEGSGSGSGSGSDAGESKCVALHTANYNTKYRKCSIGTAPSLDVGDCRDLKRLKAAEKALDDAMEDART